MNFQPILPLGGFSGWTFLNRTLDAQQETFSNSVVVDRETEYFREKIGSIRTAEELVSDRTLRKVALGAFGLQDDLPNIYFVQKVLEDGTLEADALANKLSDKRYLEMAELFDFGDNVITNLERPGFADDIIARYERQSFEVAVGESNSDFRLALGFERELQTVIDRNLSDDAAWFTILGTGPLREVFQTAFNLPDSFGAADLDKQLATYRDRSQSVFGTSEVADFADPEAQETIIRLFLLRSDNATGTDFSVPGASALSLLSRAF